MSNSLLYALLFFCTSSVISLALYVRYLTKELFALRREMIWNLRGAVYQEKSSLPDAEAQKGAST